MWKNWRKQPTPLVLKKNNLKKVKVELQIKGIAPFLAFSHLVSVDFYLFACPYWGTAGS